MTSTVSLMTSSKDGNIVPGSRIDTSTDTIKLGDGQLIKGWELGITGACQARDDNEIFWESKCDVIETTK